MSLEESNLHSETEAVESGYEHSASKPKPDYDVVTNRLAGWSLGLGIAGAAIYQVIIIPIAAFVLGIMAVSRNDPGRLTGKWMGWIGIVLGGIYTLLAIVRLLQALVR